MKPDIFQFSDYRKYLKSFYEWSKETNDKFSYRYFAKRAGYASSNFLYLIIEGKRNLTKNYIAKFADAIELNKREQQYFDALVSFNHATSPEAKRYYLELLHNLSHDKTGRLLAEGQYEYISTWYYPVIRELVTLPNFNEDPKWIKRQLNDKVSVKEITEAIDTLTRLMLLGRDETGRLIQLDNHIITEDEVANVGAYKFHQQMLSMAKMVLSSTDSHEREISGITMAISTRQFNEIKRKIHEFEDSILKYLTHNPDVPEQVFQMNIQLFSVTNTNNGGVQ